MSSGSTGSSDSWRRLLEPAQGDGETVVMTARPSQEVFDAWIGMPGRGRANLSHDARLLPAVLVGAVAVWLGFPRADPIIGLLITVAILKIVWDSAKAVFTRALDGVDPEVVDDIRPAVNHTPGVVDVTETRVRWIGHRLYAELNVAVASDLSVERGHQVAVEVRHQLLHQLPFLSDATIHIDAVTASDQIYHRIPAHRHDELPPHSH